MSRFLDQRLRLRHLRLVEAIATQRSGARAARALSISQPALTKSLREIEALFDERLFERTPRGMQPTAVGEVVVRYAREIAAALHRMEDEIDRLASAAAGAVEIGALPGAAGGLLPTVLSRAKSQYPGLTVRVVQGRTDDLLPMLAAGDLDLIVGRLYPPQVPDGVSRETLYHEPFAAIARAGHPIFRKARPRLADLRSYDLILPTFSQRIGQELEHFLAKIGLPASPETLRSTSVSFMREMLLTSDIVTVASRALVAGDIFRGDLRVVPLRLAVTPRPAGLLVRSDRKLSRAALTMIAIIRDSVVEAAAKGYIDITVRL